MLDERQHAVDLELGVRRERDDVVIDPPGDLRHFLARGVGHEHLGGGAEDQRLPGEQHLSAPVQERRIARCP